MGELSLRWILFLAVFLIVAGSVGLAASLWQRFNAPSQYLVLLVYTLAFFISSKFSQRRSALRLTTLTLQIVTGLLIPFNVWTMGGLGLGKSWLGLLTLGLATPALALILFKLLDSVPPLAARVPLPTKGRTQAGRTQAGRTKGSLFLLSLLQWGLGNFPGHLPVATIPVATIYGESCSPGLYC
jgi:hypothetical protein